MDSLPVFQQNDPKIPACLRDPGPLPYSPVGLYFGLHGGLDRLVYPFVPYYSPVWPVSHVFEVPTCLHFSFQSCM